jgi:hypothetical protein
MAKKDSGSPIKTGGSGAKDTPTGDHGGVGKHEPSKGTERVGTVPADVSKHDPNFGHRIKD